MNKNQQNFACTFIFSFKNFAFNNAGLLGCFHGFFGLIILILNININGIYIIIRKIN